MPVVSSFDVPFASAEVASGEAASSEENSLPCMLEPSNVDDAKSALPQSVQWFGDDESPIPVRPDDEEYDTEGSPNSCVSESMPARIYFIFLHINLKFWFLISAKLKFQNFGILLTRVLERHRGSR